ncbi:MAG: DUF4340 domain-containing protein [Syntrophobacteraceae bacterium]|nr:DUF4340 domain-containing protein [Syntrophobacteraceae bacterium]
MKFRATALYLLILLAMVAVYAGIKVEKEKTARKEKESRQVFTFAPATVSQIEITSGQNKAIKLKKAGKWMISSPIVSEVDTIQLTGLLSTLHTLEMERKIGKPAGNLKAFGLDLPTFSLRFLTGSKWRELDTGAQNPVGANRYAMAGKNGEVFLISSQAYDDLNKNLTNLRRKELFSWSPGQVKTVRIQWKNGDRLDIARQGDTSIWKSKSRPSLKISADKVDKLLEGLHWLRAADFLANGAMPPSPDVEVEFQLQDGKTAKLQVALPGAGQKQAIAVSSELQDPVLLAANNLSSLPHSEDSLVDRSLLSSNTSDIKKISWKMATSSGELVRMGDASWGKAEGKSPPKPLKKSWPVESLLAFLHGTEYIAPVTPAEKPPGGAQNTLEVTDVFGKKTTLTWSVSAPKSPVPVDVWLEKEGSTLEVTVQSKDIVRLGDSLAKISPAESLTPKKNAKK